MKPAIRLKGSAALRARLLCCTALSGFAALAAPAAVADTVTTVGTITNWQDSAGNNTTTPDALPGLISDDATTVTVSLQGSRTILDWSSSAPLNIGAGKTLWFQFLGKPDIVLNRIAAGSATINGALTATVAGQPGGNIWIAARDGVVFGDGAVVSTGGLLATTSPMSTSDGDFLTGAESVSGSNHTFTFGTGTSTVTIGDAHITVNGGLLAFVAPVVTSAATTGGNGIDGTGSVLYGAADAFKITLVPDGATNWDLVSFEVPAGSGSSTQGTVIALSGNTNVAGSAYLAAVNSTIATDVISVGGAIATAATVDDNGNIVLSAGHDIVNNAAVIAANGGSVGIDVTAGGELDAAGNVTLRAQGGIGSDGPVSAGGTLTLVAGGAIDAAGGALTAASLTGSSGGTADLSNAGNVIASIGSFTNTAGALTVQDTTPLTITGTVDATGQTLTINNTGGGVTATGAVKAATLTGSSTGAANFSSTSNVIGTLNGFTNTSGSLSVRDSVALTVSGTIDATGRTLTLRSTGGGIDASGAIVKAGTLTGSSAGAADFSNAGNVIGTLTGFTNNSGALTVKDSVAITLNGTIDASGQTLTLIDTGGGINAASATVKAATLAGSSAGAANFSNANNVIGTLNGFTNTAGALTVRDSTALTISGTVDATGQTLTLTDTGGGIAASGGVIKAATLTGSSAGAANFSNAGNAIGTLNGFTNTSGALTVRDSTALTVTGTVDATGQTLTLIDSGGGIDASGAVVKAGTLTGSSAGAANFSNAGNVIGTLNGFTNTAGALTVRDSTALTISGTVDATGQTLTLTDTGGGIAASGGVIKAATLTGSTAGAANFSNAGNVIGTLHNFTNAAGALTVSDSVLLTVTGTIDATGQTLTLNDTGGGIDASGAIVKAGTLSGSSAGAADFSNAGNVVGTLNGFTNTAGALSVKDSTPLTIIGTVDATGQVLTLNDTGGGIEASGAVIKAATLTGSSAGAVNFSNAGNVIGTLNGFTNIAGALTVADSAPLAITGTIDTTGQTLTINDNGGGIDASTAVIKAATLTGSSGGAADFSNAGNVIGTLNGFTNISGPLTVKDSTPLTITGTVDATGQVLTVIDSGGGINAASATVKAATLTGSSTGIADLSNAGNVIGTLNGFSNISGALTITDSAALTISGTIDVTGHTLTLIDTGGGIAASGGAIKAATLTGSSAGAADFSNTGNVIQTVNGFTNTEGALTIRDSVPLTIDGTIDASGQILSLTDTGGGIDASGAIVKAATLTGSSAGGADFSNAGNVIGTLNGFTNTAGALSVKGSTPLTIIGTVDATDQVLTLNDTGGGIDASGAVIKAATLTGSSAGVANFSNAGNVIGTLNNFTNTAGALTVADSAPLVVAGTIDATGQTLTVNDNGGGIDASGAVIKAATLTGSSAGAANFSNASNVIGTLNNFTNVAGALTVNDSAPLTVTGTIDAAGQTLTLTDTGGGIDASGGVIKAATLTGSSAGAANFSNAGNVIGTLQNFTNTAGALTVHDSAPLAITGTIDATGQTLTVNDGGGGIDASGATVKAAILTGSSAGAADFSNAANVIGTLNGFTNTAGALIVKDSVPLMIAGTLDSSGQVLTLNDTGGGIDASGAVVKAATLTGSSAGAANFSNAGNVIETINGFSNTAGSLSVRDSAPLTITGTVDATGQTLTLNDTGGGIAASGATIKASILTGSSAGAADFSNAGNVIQSVNGFTNTEGALTLRDSVPLTIGGTIDASGQTLSVTDAGGGIDAAGAIIKAATLTGSSAGAADFSNAGNVIGTVNGFTNVSGPLTITDSAALTITGTVDASGQTLTLNDSGGGIDASGGIVKAKALTGSTAGDANFSNPGNAVETLGDFATGNGDFTLVNSGTLDVQGAVVAGALDSDGVGSKDIALNTVSGNLTITGADGGGAKLQGRNVSLTSAGSILIGSSDFIAEVQSEQDPILADILIDAMPGEDTGNVFIVADSLNVDSPGTILQENTGTTSDPDGIHIFHSGTTPAILIEGRPLVVNLFGTLVMDGSPITSTAIATSAGVQIVPQFRNNHYRANGCVIGQTGFCTIVQFNIGNIEPLRLTDLLTIQGGDEGNQNDPTITGAGNDELWGQP